MLEIRSIRFKSFCIALMLVCGACGTKQQTSSNEIHEMTDGGTWTGDILNKRPFGYGTYTWSNGTVYEGNFGRDGGRHGFGIETWVDGAKYVGWHIKNKKTTGTYYWPSGASWEGGFKDNQPHGKGIYTDTTGRSYDKTYSPESATYKEQENSPSSSESRENQSLKSQREDHYRLEFICLFDPDFEDPFLAGKGGELSIDSKRDTLILTYDRKDKSRMALWNSFRKVGQSYYGEKFLTNKSSKFTLDAKSGKATYERGEMIDNKLRFLEMHCIKK